MSLYQFGAYANRVGPDCFCADFWADSNLGGRAFCYMHTYIQEMQVEDMIEWQTGACGALLCRVFAEKDCLIEVGFV